MKYFALFGLMMLTFFAACSKSSSSSSASGPTSLDALPKATAPVSSSTSAYLPRDLEASTTGVVLKTAVTSTFASKSRAFCETAQTVKNLIREASQNDKIGCYVGAMELAGAFTNSYDGNYHYYSLSGARERSSLLVKFKSTKSGSVIDSFTMFTCEGGTQQEYLNTTIASGVATLTAVGSHSHTSGGNTASGLNRVTVTGNVSSSGWSGNKTIIGQGIFSMSSGGSTVFTDNRYVEMVQSATTVTLSGSASFTNSNVAGGVLVYSIIQGLGMGGVSTFALGDGTAKAQFTYDGNTNSGEASWNGDTKLNLSDVTAGDNYAAVHAASLPKSTTPSPALTSTETWNCNPETSFETINFATLSTNATFAAAFAACNAKYEMEDAGNGGFIDCPHNGN